MAPPMKMKGVPAKPQNIKGTVQRLLSYMRPYKSRLVLVCICILISSVTTSMAALFMKQLIDGYILPMVAGETPIMSLGAMIGIASCILFLGVFCGYLYNRLMVTIAHGATTQIPNGDSQFQQGDTVVVVTNRREVIRQLNDIFA